MPSPESQNRNLYESLNVEKDEVKEENIKKVEQLVEKYGDVNDTTFEVDSENIGSKFLHQLNLTQSLSTFQQKRLIKLLKTPDASKYAEIIDNMIEKAWNSLT